jgi:hypothetical protein
LGQDLFYKDCWELILHQDFIFLWIFIVKVEHNAQ